MRGVRPVLLLLALAAALAAWALLDRGRSPDGPRPAAPGEEPREPSPQAPPPSAPSAPDDEAPSEPAPPVTGIVRFEDGRPAVALPLRAWTIDPTWPGEFFVATDERGRFCIEGLPADWSGYVALPAGHEFPEGGRNADVDPEHRTLDLVVRRLPMAVGRVLTAEGAPAAKARVFLHWTTAEGERVLRATHASRDGRFAFEVPEDRRREASVRVRSESGIVEAVREVDPTGLSGAVDLGDFALPPVREVVLLVLARDCSPVSGATATILQTPGHPDGSGPGARHVLELPLDATPVHLEAFGYTTRTVTVPGDAPSPFEVRLDRAAKLTVRAVGADGEPAPGVFVVFETSERLLVPQEGTDVLRGGMTALADAEGRAVVAPVRPGLVFSVLLRDQLTRKEIARTTVSLEPGEWREIELVASDPGRELSGRVVGPHGNPVEGARVRIRATEKGPSRSVASAPDGSFRIAAVRADRVLVQAWARDHVPWEAEIAVREGIEIRLSASHTVRLTVTDGTGTRLRADSADAVFGNRTARGRVQSDGIVVYESLPAGRSVLRVHYAGRRFETEHDTCEPEAELRIPTCGTLTVTVRGFSGGTLAGVLQLVPTDGRGGPRHTWLTGTGPHTLAFAPVLPGRYRVVLRDLRDEKVLAESEEFLVASGRETRVTIER